MPFTPYHFGPALLIGVIFFPFISVGAIMVSSVIVDLEPFTIIIYRTGMPLHGFFHTYLGASLAALATAGVWWVLRNPLNEFLSLFRVQQDASFKKILFTCVLGTCSHVFLDSFLYAEMNPFFPILGNPFLGMLSGSLIYDFCTACLVIGGLAYFFRFCLMWKRDTSAPLNSEEIWKG